MSAPTEGDWAIPERYTDHLELAMALTRAYHFVIQQAIHPSQVSTVQSTFVPSPQGM